MFGTQKCRWFLSTKPQFPMFIPPMDILYSYTLRIQSLLTLQQASSYTVQIDCSRYKETALQIKCNVMRFLYKSNLSESSCKHAEEISQGVRQLCLPQFQHQILISKRTFVQKIIFKKVIITLSYKDIVIVYL